MGALDQRMLGKMYLKSKVGKSGSNFVPQVAPPTWAAKTAAANFFSNFGGANKLYLSSIEWPTRS